MLLPVAKVIEKTGSELIELTSATKKVVFSKIILLYSINLLYDIISENGEVADMSSLDI